MQRRSFLRSLLGLIPGVKALPAVAAAAPAVMGTSPLKAAYRAWHVKQTITSLTPKTLPILCYATEELLRDSCISLEQALDERERETMKGMQASLERQIMSPEEDDPRWCADWNEGL